MAKSKLQPLGSRVLISPDKAEEMTKGGLYIPSSANEKKPGSGVVVKLGTGRTKSGKEIKFDVKEGDRVFFKQYAPEEVEVDGETFLLVNTEDILAVIN
jgi:chaperonin GroES